MNIFGIVFPQVGYLIYWTLLFLTFLVWFTYVINRVCKLLLEHKFLDNSNQCNASSNTGRSIAFNKINIDKATWEPKPEGGDKYWNNKEK